MWISAALIVMSMGLFSSSLLAQQNIAICPIKPLDRGQTTASNIKEFFGNFKNAGRTKISEFLCCLPQNVRDGVMVAHSSIALQNGHPQSPRVLVFDLGGGQDEDGDGLYVRSVFSVNRGLHGNTNGNSIEAAFTDEKTGKVTLFDINFSETPPKLVDVTNSQSCKGCHGSPPHLIFDTKIWSRFVKGNNSLLSENRKSQEFNILEKYGKEAEKSYLNEPKFSCLNRVIRDGSNFQMEVDAAIDLSNTKRVGRLLPLTPHYDQIKYALVGANMCPSFAEDLDCQLSKVKGVKCNEWLSSDMLEMMIFSKEIRPEIDKKNTLQEIQSVANDLLAQQKRELFDQFKNSKKETGINFYYNPHLLTTNKIALDPKIKSPLLAKYAVDTSLYGSENYLVRFLMESRGFSIGSFSTDVVSGYQRTGIVPRAILMSEPKGSVIRTMLESLDKKTSKAEIEETCKRLRGLSRKASVIPLTQKTQFQFSSQ